MISLALDCSVIHNDHLECTASGEGRAHSWSLVLDADIIYLRDIVSFQIWIHVGVTALF